MNSPGTGHTRLERGDMAEISDAIARRVKFTRSGCWEWTGQIRDDGYGVLRQHRAHRLVYEALVGPIPDGLVLDHLCRVRHCVNPAHLEPVTSRENSLRGEGAPGSKSRQTHCINGHELVGHNVYLHPQRGTRNCRTCMIQASRDRRAGLKNTEPCSVQGCGRLSTARGMCQAHYMRWWKTQRTFNEA